jgi:hypothetical protein
MGNTVSRLYGKLGWGPTTTEAIDIAPNTQVEAPKIINRHALPDGKVKPISNPTTKELSLAAVIFGQVASKADLSYAIIGGVSALIFGSMRASHGLDILYEPNTHSPLFDNDQSIFGYRGANIESLLILIYEDRGIPLNLINCQNNKYGFPDLQGPTHPDGTPLDADDPEPTWDYQSIHLTDRPSISLKVLIPRILLQQRLRHFPSRPNEEGAEERQKKDVVDIAAYLGFLLETIDQSFKSEEAKELVSYVEEVMRFAKQNGIEKGLEADGFRWLMIPVVEEDLKEK